MRIHAFITLLGFHVLTVSVALAQATGDHVTQPGETATPALQTGYGYWLWVIVALVAIGMGLMVFARRSRKRRD